MKIFYCGVNFTNQIQIDYFGAYAKGSSLRILMVNMYEIWSVYRAYCMHVYALPISISVEMLTF